MSRKGGRGVCGWVHPNGENSASHLWLGCREYLLGAGFLYNYTVAKNIFTYPYYFSVLSMQPTRVLTLAGNDGDIQTLTVTFETLLSFATGAPRPPPAGYKPIPTLAFEDQRFAAIHPPIISSSPLSA